jgi:hypothetical protein
MSFFILLFLLVDGIILAASHFSGSAWGAAVCNNSLGLCAYTVPLLVTAVIGIGLYYVQR